MHTASVNFDLSDDPHALSLRQDPFLTAAAAAQPTSQHGNPLVLIDVRSYATVVPETCLL